MQDLGYVAWVVPCVLVVVCIVNYYGLWTKWVVVGMGIDELAATSSSVLD
jgi:hypothetical protein